MLQSAVLEAMLSSQRANTAFIHAIGQVIGHPDENFQQSLDAAAQNVLAAQNLVNHAITQWEKNIVNDFNRTMGKQPVL